VAERQRGELFDPTTEECVIADYESVGLQSVYDCEGRVMSWWVLACKTWTCSPSVLATVCNSLARMG
jgi:hypothetical protein